MTAAELIAALAECEPTATVNIALPLRDGFETQATVTRCEKLYSSQHEHEAPKPDRIYLRFDCHHKEDMTYTEVNLDPTVK